MSDIIFFYLEPYTIYTIKSSHLLYSYKKKKKNTERKLHHIIPDKLNDKLIN